MKFQFQKVIGMTFCKPILILILIFSISIFGKNCFAQTQLSDPQTIDDKLEFIQLLTDTEQYSAAMEELKALEKSEGSNTSIKNRVRIKLLVARSLRLLGKFDDAMIELNSLPNLEEFPKLKLNVDFAVSALYLENPKFTVEERLEILSPIINVNIQQSKALKDTGMMASFLNMSACLHKSECLDLRLNCQDNYLIASKEFNEAMKYFLILKDTSNYHNAVNLLFALEMDNETDKIEEAKDKVCKMLEVGTYAPNIINSHNLLYAYYNVFKNDSVKSLWELVQARDANMEMISKNADNTIEKMKLLYQFDTLQTSVAYNKKLVANQATVIQQNTQRLNQAIIFGVILGVLILILVILFVRQRKFSQKLNKSNIALSKSNLNFELLIKESNHRIKNNLQMILSMLELGKNNASAEEVTLLTTISAKISTITALHRMLNFKEHNQKVSLPTYMNEIVSFYENLHARDLHFNKELTDVYLKSERIIYFGLILNEMISNTIKHAGEESTVNLKVVFLGANYSFTFQDNSNFGEFTKNSGINLIEDLVSRFGGDDFELDANVGMYRFTFNE